MKLLRKIADERQELEQMRIERMGFWALLGALVIAINVQVIFFDVGFEDLAGEFFVLLAVGLAVVIMQIKKGIWSYFSNPGIKSYALYSVFSAVIFSLLAAGVQYHRSVIPKAEIMETLLPRFSLNLVGLFAVSFVLLAVTGNMTKKRRAKLESDYAENEY